MPLRIVFCGTPAFGLPSLKKLLADPGCSVEAVITQPDRPRGRGRNPARSPIKDAALDAGLQIYQPERIKSEDAMQFLKGIAPDAVIIIAYGQIIPRDLLEIPRLGWINLHGSLLPQYRGAAPIQRAILNGNTRTGLTTMRIDAGLDTGPILEQLEVEIRTDETAPELMARMGDSGAPLLLNTLRKFETGEIKPRDQDNARATFAPPLKKEEGLIDWNRRAGEIYNHIRAFQPWPGTFSHFRGRLCQLWGRAMENPSDYPAHDPGLIVERSGEMLVACGEGTWLRVEYVQAEGRKRMSAREFANGARISSGEKFTS